MELSDVRGLLEGHGYVIKDENRLGNETGVALRIEGGPVVNVYDNGNVHVQGRNPGPIRELLGQPAQVTFAKPKAAPLNTKVFVVYGHDSDAKVQLEAMLRRWGLDPLILDQLPSEGQTIIEKLESYTGQVDFAVVLATPDDEGHKAGKPDEKSYRARQNVVLELGMLLSLLGRKRVAILLKEQDKMERPSDIQGLIYIPFKENLAKEAGLLLAKELSAQGYHIDVKKI
jgi:predicted nucleotide-binding protein